MRSSDCFDPEGCSANLEVVASPTAELHAAFRAAIGREEDDPEDRLVAVGTQLGWMRAAGYEQVDCIWKWRGFALLVGVAPATSRGAGSVQTSNDSTSRIWPT